MKYTVQHTAPPTDVGQAQDDQDRDNHAGRAAGEFNGSYDEDDADNPFGHDHANATLINGIFHAHHVESARGCDQPKPHINEKR